MRKYKAFPYEDSGQVKYASSDRPIFRYAQNFKKEELKFSLCLFTDEQSKSNVDKYFKKVANDLTQADISMALVNSSATKFMYIEKELYRGDE